MRATTPLIVFISWVLVACGGSLDEPVAVPQPQPQPQPETQPQQQQQQQTPEQTTPAETSNPVVEQGLACNAAELGFEAKQKLESCATVDVVVRGPHPYVWVMVGIQAASQQISWRGGVSNVNCDDQGRCEWTFGGLTVPCNAGPYKLHFMVDATNDDHTVGRVLGSCQP